MCVSLSHDVFDIYLLSSTVRNAQILVTLRVLLPPDFRCILNAADSSQLRLVIRIGYSKARKLLCLHFPAFCMTRVAIRFMGGVEVY